MKEAEHGMRLIAAALGLRLIWGNYTWSHGQVAGGVTRIFLLGVVVME